jgi:hypothetical protein
LAVAYSKKQMPGLTDELTSERYEQARNELIAAGLQFIVADEGKATCAKCQQSLDPLDLLSDWQNPEEPEEY